MKEYDLVALFLDGKTFAEDTMVIALGVTVTGEKVVLGFVQTSTDNAKVCTQLPRGDQGARAALRGRVAGDY